MELPRGNNWKDLATSYHLSHGDVHIWSASLEQPAKYRERLFLLLSFDEKIRAERFYFEKDRNGYIVGRGLLRIILGRYLGAEPSRVEFTYGLHGKPSMKALPNGKFLEFNLSHSNNMAVYVFTWDQPVGIDIEYIHSMKGMDDFALQFFTPNECNLVHSLVGYKKQETFFRIWTCKEAFLKANGIGLTVPINQVEVSLTTEGTGKLTSIGGDRERAARWRMETFMPTPGYQASLAVEGDYEQALYFHM
jgi:4'-phosphopantetheinyl transferase